MLPKIKLGLLFLAFLGVFRYCIYGGINLLRYSPLLKESNEQKMDNYFLTKGIVKNIELIKEKHHSRIDDNIPTPYEHTYQYTIEVNHQVEKLIEEKRDLSRKKITPTYQISDSISFYKNKDTIYSNISIKEYQEAFKNKSNNRYAYFGGILLVIGLILNGLITKMILKNFRSV